MSAVIYTNYNFQALESLDEYSALYVQYENNPSFTSTTKENTTKFVRNLGMFEIISTFFELLLDSFYACFKSDNSDLAQRNKAWKALKRWQFVKVVELKIESASGQLCEKSNRVPELSVSIFEGLPSELNLLIIRANSEMSFLGLGCCVSKKWKTIFSQDVLWKPFFSFLAIPKGIKIKDFLASRSASSPEQLLEKIKKFSNLFQRDKRCELHLYSISESLQANEEASTIKFEECKVIEPPQWRHEFLIVNLPDEYNLTVRYILDLGTADRFFRFKLLCPVIPASQRQQLDKLLMDRFFAVRSIFYRVFYS